MKRKKILPLKKVLKKKEPIVEKKELDYIPLGKCSACKKLVKDTDLANDINAFNKFASSGLCKKCQCEEQIETDESVQQM